MPQSKRSQLASRFNFPSLQRSSAGTQKNTTLISHPIPLANSTPINGVAASAATAGPDTYPVHRQRTISSSSVDTVRGTPDSPRLDFRKETKKRSREVALKGSGETRDALLEDIPRTRQRLSSTSSVDTVRIKTGDFADRNTSTDESHRSGSAQVNDRPRASLRRRPVISSLAFLNPGRATPTASITTSTADDVAHFIKSNDDDTSLRAVVSQPTEEATRGVTGQMVGREINAWAEAVGSCRNYAGPPGDANTDIDDLPEIPSEEAEIQGDTGFSDVAVVSTCTDPPVLVQRPKVPTTFQATFWPPMPEGLREHCGRSMESGSENGSTEFEEESDEEDDGYESDWLYSSKEPTVDVYGNIIDLSVRHLDLSVTFYREQPFFDVWDMDDSAYIGFPARIHFNIKDHLSSRYGAIPSRLDLRCIDITCESFEYKARRIIPPSCGAEQSKPEPYFVPNSDTPEYSVSYRGEGIPPSLDAATYQPSDILLHRKWYKTFPHRTPTVKDSGAAVVAEGGEKRKGWYVKVWVPIPVKLFKVKETRAFRLDVAAWVGDDERGGLLTAQSDMVISHLKRAKEMT